MSDTDSFIREVTEEVRQDRMLRYWKRYGPYVLGVIAAVILAALVSAWLEGRAEEEALETGAALAEARGAEAAEVERLLAGVEGEARLVARMRLAQAQAEAGDRAIAADGYRAVAEDAGAPARYADLARLEAARLDATNGRTERALSALDEMVVAEGPYAALAQELRAALRLNDGDVAGARADLQAVAASPQATADTRARVRALAATLPAEEDPAGGAVEGAPEVGAPEPDLEPATQDGFLPDPEAVE